MNTTSLYTYGVLNRLEESVESGSKQQASHERDSHPFLEQMRLTTGEIGII